MTFKALSDSKLSLISLGMEINKTVWMPSSLHETPLEGTMLDIVNIGKQGTAFVTMLPCNCVSQEELTLLFE